MTRSILNIDLSFGFGRFPIYYRTTQLMKRPDEVNDYDVLCGVSYLSSRMDGRRRLLTHFGQNIVRAYGVFLLVLSWYLSDWPDRDGDGYTNVGHKLAVYNRTVTRWGLFVVTSTQKSSPDEQHSHPLTGSPPISDSVTKFSCARGIL